MSTIITKFSDYTIQSIEFFISEIQTELGYRDLKGLSNNRIEILKPTKQHPLAQLMATQLSENVNADVLRSNLLPAISVVPGDLQDEGFALGQSYKSEIVDSDFIEDLQEYLIKTNKEIQESLLITTDQISTIISEYNKREAGQVRVQRNEWRRNEEINISIWSDSPDISNLLTLLIESILATIQIGFVGTDSGLRNFKFKPSRGLTNFNFGRTIFGTEYNLTFLNTYNNYIIYTDDNLSGHDFQGTFTTLDEE